MEKFHDNLKTKTNEYVHLVYRLTRKFPKEGMKVSSFPLASPKRSFGGRGKFQVSRKNGFTIIEVLVSVAVLGIILMVVTNLFASTLGAGKQALDYQKLAGELRNVTFIIEKDINNKNGIAEAQGNPSNNLKIYDTDSQVIEYNLNGGAKKIQRIKGTDTALLTSGNIEVNSLSFHIINTLLDTDPSNDSQPRVTINIEAKPKNGRKVIKTQITISEKNY